MEKDQPAILIGSTYPLSYCFFLGGHDAEMISIRELITAAGIPCHDAGLAWDNANVSTYHDKIAGLAPDVIPIFVELQLDMPIPANSQIIDHHGEKAGLTAKTSLEQVAELLQITLDRRQLLISANDRGYISEMVALSASLEEIAEIRAFDRKAQGVTEEDERLAVDAITNRLEKLSPATVLVTSTTNKTSPVFDRLHGRFDNVFIYTPNGGMSFSGSGRVVERLQESFKEKKKTEKDVEFWYGGALPHSGYFGSNKTLKKKEVRDMDIVSQHIFLFPFTIQCRKPDPHNPDCDKSRSTIGALLKLDGWRYDKFDPNDSGRNYSEFVYFHKYVRDTAYNDDKQDGAKSFVDYYKKPISRDDEFIIQVNGSDKQYRLQLDHISLHVFETGVGILTIEALNRSYTEFDDVRKINDLGRRVFPQFLGLEDGVAAPKQSGLLPGSITLKHKSEEIHEPFNHQCYFDTINREIIIARHIRYLIGENFLKDYRADPVIDDRMFTVCWHGNTVLSDELCECTGKDYAYEDSERWYQYVYVDGGSSCCKNVKMLRNLIADASYARWVEEYGTLYGLTRYSLMALTKNDCFGSNVVRDHMQCHYYQMAVFLLAQRASIISFATRISRISHEIDKLKQDGKNNEFEEIAKQVRELHGDFIGFVNRLWFEEVTPQEQGIEMFTIAQTNMRLKEQVEELKSEMRELIDFVEMHTDRIHSDSDRARAKEDSEMNRTMLKLTQLASFALPITIMLAFWGMSYGDLFSDNPNPAFFKEILISYRIVFVLFTIIGAGLFGYFLRRRNFGKSNENQEGA